MIPSPEFSTRLLRFAESGRAEVFWVWWTVLDGAGPSFFSFVLVCGNCDPWLSVWELSLSWDSHVTPRTVFCAARTFFLLAPEGAIHPMKETHHSQIPSKHFQLLLAFVTPKSLLEKPGQQPDSFCLYFQNKRLVLFTGSPEDQGRTMPIPKITHSLGFALLFKSRRWGI